MQYTASTRGYRKFDLLDDTATIIGRLDYPSVFSSSAQIIINERQVYDMKVAGFWGTSRQLYKSGVLFATLKANLRGSVEIYFETGKTLYFRRKNIFYNEFIMTDGTEQLLAELRGDFKWRKLSFDYEMDVHTNMLDREINSLIPFLMAYCAMYLKRRTAAAG
jgi:hypothetical protein